MAAGDEGARRVTIAAGATTAALAVATVDDGTDEPDGSVSATLASGAGYTVSTTAGAASVAVADNDASGALSMSIHDAEGPEGSKIAFRVTLSRPSPGRVQAFWITSRKGSTATEGVDYAFGVGRVAFVAGESEKTVHVQTFDDAHNDPGETFRVKLIHPHNAVIADGERKRRGGQCGPTAPGKGHRAGIGTDQADASPLTAKNRVDLYDKL